MQYYKKRTSHSLVGPEQFNCQVNPQDAPEDCDFDRDLKPLMDRLNELETKYRKLCLTVDHLENKVGPGFDDAFAEAEEEALEDMKSESDSS